MKTYEETLQGILEIPKFTTKNNPGHTREFLRRLGNPQEKYKVIHVAGSNGKGSVCAFIASVLRESGRKTGLFTSPHLVQIEERFDVDGGPCARETFLRAADTVQAVVAQMQKDGLPHPTFFEYIFAVSMVIFAEAEVEYAVLETGIGGRLDATNIVQHPVLTVITSIGLEHTEILGDTLELIAAEKAGILKPGVPVVFDASAPEATEVITARAKELACPIFPVLQEKIKILLNTGKKIAFSYDSRYDVTEAAIPFGAPYQAQNAAVALMAVNCLGEWNEIPSDAVRRGFAGVCWKGRMQEVLPQVYLDGAHNVSGIAVFLDAVEQIAKGASILLFSMVREKRYAQVVQALVQRGNWDEIILTRIPNNRGLMPEELEELFRREGKAVGKNNRITAIKDIEEAFAEAMRRKRQEQAVFCAGSLYLIGELERVTGGMKRD